MRGRPSGGFTYLGLVMLLAVLGLVAAAGLKMGTLMQRAAAEEELLEIGAQFSEALRSYAAATPQGKPQQPPSLKELLKDSRFPNPRRHLRKIFVDPVTGKAEWGIIYLGDKIGVIGVYSLSAARPLKVANFDIRFQNMDNRQHISDWKFLMAGGDGLVPPVLTPPNSMTAPPLFAPAAPLAPGEPKPGQGAPPPDGQPLEAPPPAPPPEPAEPEQPKAEAPKGEGDEPMAVPPAEEGKEVDAVAPPEDGDAKAAEPSTVAPPPRQRR